MPSDLEFHEDARMAAETLLQERSGSLPGLVQQQLRLDTMDTWRLLQCFDHMRKQPLLDDMAIDAAPSVQNNRSPITPLFCS